MTTLILPEDDAMVSQKTDVMRLFERDIRKNAWVWRRGSFAAGTDGVLTRPAPVRFEFNYNRAAALEVEIILACPLRR